MRPLSGLRVLKFQRPKTAAEVMNLCQHVLLACPRFHNLRQEIWEENYCRREGMDLKKILNMPRLAKKTALFITLTRLLRQYGAVSENEISQGEH